MHKLNKYIVCSMLLIINSMPVSATIFGVKEAAEALAPALKEAGVETAKIISPHLKELAQAASQASLNAGMKSAQILAPAVEEAAKKVASDAAATLAPALQGSAQSLAQLGVKPAEIIATMVKENQTVLLQASKNFEIAAVDFGKNVGLATTQAIGNGITAAAAATKSAAVATGASIKSAALATAATAKSTAIAVAAAPATPYILIGAGVIVVSYGGYKVYRHYHPTQAQIAAALKMQAEIEKHKVDIVKSQVIAAEFKKALAKEQREEEFKAALARNLTSKRNANGIPFACQKEAVFLAMAAGSKKVEKIVASFNKYAPAPQAA